MIFINCAAIIDLSEKWFASEEAHIKTFLFDSHRPLHLNNIYSKSRIIIVDDGLSNLGECPQPDDFEQEIDDEDLMDSDGDDGEAIYGLKTCM